MFTWVIGILVIVSCAMYSPSAMIGVVGFFVVLYAVWDLCEAIECKRKYGTFYNHGRWLVIPATCAVFYGFLRLMALGPDIVGWVMGEADPEKARLCFTYVLVFTSVTAYPVMLIVLRKGSK